MSKKKEIRDLDTSLSICKSIASELNTISALSKAKTKVSSLKKKYSADPIIFNSLSELELRSKRDFLKSLHELKNILRHELISLHGTKKIPKGGTILLHGYNPELISLIRHARRHKNFEVLVVAASPTEESKKISKKLSKLTIYPDAEIRQAIKKADVLFIGAHALSKKRIVAAMGSEMAAELARINNIPVYVVASKLRSYSKDSFGFHTLKSKNRKHAYEQIHPETINSIINEYGIYSYKHFKELHLF